MIDECIKLYVCVSNLSLNTFFLKAVNNYITSGDDGNQQWFSVDSRIREYLVSKCISPYIYERHKRLRPVFNVVNGFVCFSAEEWRSSIQFFGDFSRFYPFQFFLILTSTAPDQK